MTNLSRSSRTRRVAAAALAAVMIPGLAGCFNGPAATTTVQSTTNSGNGAQATAGKIRIDNATLVHGPLGSNSATLLMRVTNIGDQADQLVGATINGVPAGITGGSVDIPAGEGVSFGYESPFWVNTYDLGELEPSQFVDTTLMLRDAGEVPMQVLAVPPLGQYEGIAPEPPAPAVLP